MDFYGVKPKDLDGIVSQLRNTRGVEVAIFMYELDQNVFKVSLRSGNEVDVSKIAGYLAAVDMKSFWSYYDRYAAGYSE